MAAIVGNLRTRLRSQRLWCQWQESRREGWSNVARRRWYQRQILGTPPMRVSCAGPVEVRALTWRRDWINVLWALKSFYHFAGVDYPLFIHDGGLAPGQAAQLLAHFPDATLIPRAESDVRVEAELRRRGYLRSLEYRRRNPSTRKLFDFFLFSQADYQIAIDSDIVFFARPDLLIVPPQGVAVNRYNRDEAEFYSMSSDELEAAFGLRPPPRINSGLALIRRESIDFGAIESWLQHPKLFADPWVTEQTLHALCGAAHGVEFLPDSYLVSTRAGLPPGLVCKHYPSFFRVWLYREGMRHLIETGFLRALRTRRAAGEVKRAAPAVDRHDHSSG
jgi:hypothetical protein